MIRVRGLGGEVSLKDIEKHLADTGIHLDASYGPFALNGAYIVRGMASPDAVERARQIKGVEIFGDIGITATEQD